MLIIRIKMKALREKRTEMMQTLLSMIAPAGKENGCLAMTSFVIWINKPATEKLESNLLTDVSHFH